MSTNIFIRGFVLDKNKNEVKVDVEDTIDSPFFRNTTGYRTVIEDKKIKELIAYYYYNV